MSKKVIITLSAVLLIAIVAVVILIISRKPIQDSNNNPVSAAVDDSAKIALDLKTAFTKATTSLNLPTESIFMVNSYTGDESNPQNFIDSSSKKMYYMASTIKPLFIAAYLNLLEVKDLDTKIPFKFIDSDAALDKIASDVADKINNDADEDILQDVFVVPVFKNSSSVTKEEVFDALKTNPELTNLQISLRDIIKYTLGPSSNLGLTLLKSDLAFKKYSTEESASNAIEGFLNNFLVSKGFKGTISITKSTKSNSQQTSNSAQFNEMELLFDSLYKNEFNLTAEQLAFMKESMREVGSDPARHNRRQETKTIMSEIVDPNKFNIVEKSGYVGLDFEAIPGLNKANGLDTLPAQDGKRIVFFSTSAFARIYLNNGKFVQYNFSISTPVYISLDPAYEELNNDYLITKNKIFDSLDTNIKAVLEKYKSEIEVK